ncbi:hypothetical protein AWB80_03098 [Caballeronia pedi]|uniref:Bacterial toxin YdaT domain-containing protein n=1 Tax=Caballeronia pedi TaxID=1777141 RepID=A0A158B6P0_9BURK|nr:hypothetical protein [Caballeronia pedi]SAK65723.1 hypothetical protein AWB80_03098 [Caballeronia pedi]
MRSESHKTRIAVIRDHVAAWRKEQGWSREAAAMAIVDAHERIGGAAVTGITFESSGDAFTTAKKNADRIWRWLDDESKDNNLMPANFENSILAAFPMERRVDVLNEILSQIDCVARARHQKSSADLNVQHVMQVIVRTNHRTESDAADLLDGIDPGELPRLHSSLAHDIREKQQVMRAVEAEISKSGVQVAELRKVS